MDATSHERNGLVTGRFERCFPVACWVIRNIWLLLPVFALGAMVVSRFSIHYGLSVLCAWMGLACLWVDRKHLEYCLITPLQPLATVLIMSLGAGVSMVVCDSEQKFQEGFFAMQMVGLIGSPLFVAAYYLVTKEVPGFVFPRRRQAGRSGLETALMVAGWICLAHELARVIAGVVSGTMDRGYAGDVVLETRFGWWSAFGVFARIQTMGFLLAPLIWRESRLVGRTLLVAMVGAILFLHFAAASRGAVFFTLFTLLIGAYMFLEFRRLKFELLILIGVAGLIPFVTIMSYYRNSEAFKQTDLRDVFKKVATIKEGLAVKQEREADSGERLAEAGRSFIGVADSVIYEMTPKMIPFAGANGLDALAWIYVPYMFSSNPRPTMADGYGIVISYTGVYIERTSIEISFASDLYRRWGWSGVAMGLTLYGFFYGAVFRFVYRLYLYKNALVGFLICGVLFHFFVSWVNGSVLSTAWYWLYDIPKNLLFVGGVYWMMKLFAGIQDPCGALEMQVRGEADAQARNAASQRIAWCRAPSFWRSEPHKL